MVKVIAAPSQRLAVGVTDIVAVTGVVPVLVAVNDGIVEEVPLAASPMDVLLFVHAKVVDEVELVNKIAEVLAVLQ